MYDGSKKGIRLTETQRLHWLQLIRCENVGPKTFYDLIKQYGSAENALNALPELIQKYPSKRIKMASRNDALREIDIAQRLNIHFIGVGEPEYPPLLRQIEGAPPLIAVRGNHHILQQSSVAIVGSRNASSVGLRLTENFTHELGLAGFCITSGLARGIDTTAHCAAIKTGTIAVMAGGVDWIYPFENKKLYHEILDNNGAIISEMPIGFNPRAMDFPRRNRIIAGISVGLLVIEAAHKSGSLISARLAAEMGRIVFAIPGSPLDPRAAGTNKLIKEGAQLVTQGEDIIETLSPIIEKPAIQTNLFQNLILDKECHKKSYDEYKIKIINEKNNEAIDENELIDDKEKILQLLSHVPIDIETLSIDSQISLQELYVILMDLELEGLIIRDIRGLVALTPK